MAPGLVAGVGLARLEAVTAATRRAVGPVTGVAETADGLVIRGQRGRVPAWAAVDADGRLSGLLIGAATPGRGGGAPLRGVCGGWVVGAVLVAAVVWTAGSVAAWAAGMCVLGLLVAGFEGFDVPPRWMLTRRQRCAARLGVVAAAASAARLPGRPGGWSGVPAGLVVLFAVALAVTVIALVRARRGGCTGAVSVPLRLPFADGTWYVAHGGGPGLNHHRRVAAQRGALDLVRLGRTGARASGLSPDRLDAYAAYGAVLLAPCDATVVRVVDGLPDQRPGRPWPCPPAGNHVVLDTGQESVVLAHLRPGTVAVRTGETVRTGQYLGRVGNSGHTTEPHLHVHAERDGVGIDLRFTGFARRLHRGVRLTAPTPPLQDSPELT